MLEISDLSRRVYYLCSKNKGTDQLCSYCTAGLRLCFLHMHAVGFLMWWLIFFHFSHTKFPLNLSRVASDLTNRLSRDNQWDQVQQMQMKFKPYHEETGFLPMQKTKAQISFAVLFILYFSTYIQNFKILTFF